MNKQYHIRLHTAAIYSGLLLLSAMFISITTHAQITPGAPLGVNGNTQQTDTSAFKDSNTDEWHNETVNVSYKLPNTDKVYYPDTSIHLVHRKYFSQPWNRDLGNFGTASRSLLFTPEYRTGPTLGYHVFDVYRFLPDSIRYYNTTAPYTIFSYNLGSKVEQHLNIMHTQNVRPNWNFAVGYRKTNSQGFYLMQRTNHDNFFASSNYESINHRYKLKAAVMYNKDQQDENGGIVNEAQLDDPDFNDRSVMAIAYANAVNGANTTTPRSYVTNVFRNYHVTLQHGYSWGRTDSTYNEDSTKLSFKFTPRFSVTHQFDLGNQQLTYKDLRPDSIRYAPFFAEQFLGNGADSVFTRQKQNTIDNNVMLNGFLGKRENQLQFSAGAGIRVDKFSTRYLQGADFTTITGNYVVGSLRKDAVQPGEWFYSANARFYVTGAAAGNSHIQATIGKDLKNFATLDAGIQQNINNAPYSYTHYVNSYDTITASLNKESVTSVYGRISSERYHFNAAIRNYLVNNYIYLNQAQLPDQYANTFNLLQVSLQKGFYWRGIVLDNEFVYQQPTTDAPVNIPQILGRHQLSYERYIFRNALKVAFGAEVRYHSSYYSAFYSPVFNRFYYQNSYFLGNQPEGSVFFNFKVKRFRSFIMVDQVQQIFTRNYIITKGYAAQNTMIRFGFNWVLLR